MPAAQRNGDLNSAGAAVTSSRNVKVNSKSITVNGDAVANHAPSHTGIKTANGSSTVKVGGVGVNRTGDADTCSTHSRVGGSSNVNIG
jgi:uncharacterized Zn-binding protein involved in type VI secretion|tara:strand:- start:538 stop:801 length:264 start_codon:yes stop_codon:yes gene_type:complete